MILLLPGACSLGFIAIFLGSGGLADLGPLPLPWLVCFVIRFGGFVVIRRAIVGARPGPHAPT